MIQCSLVILILYRLDDEDDEDEDDDEEDEGDDHHQVLNKTAFKAPISTACCLTAAWQSRGR